MKVIDLRQRTPEWLAWRAQGVSASDAAVILGMSPYKTPWRLWAEKKGLVRPEAELSSDWFRNRGIVGEDPVRVRFEEEHDTILLPLCGESDEHPVIRASFDGIDDGGEPVEIKVACAQVFQQVLDDGPESAPFRLYWPQVQTQLYVADAAQGWLVFHHQPGQQREFRVARNDAFIRGQLVPALLWFWEQVQKDREPDRDPQRDLYTPSGEDLVRWTKLAVEYRDAAARRAKLETEIKKEKAALDVLEEGLVAMMGDFLVAETAGVKVLRYSQRGSVSYKDALAALRPDLGPADLEPFRGESSDRVKVTVLREGKAQVPVNPDQLAAAREEVQADKGRFF